MFLGLDLGTGSLKALLMDADGRVVGEASRPYPVRAPHPGWAESDPEDWWRAAGEAARALPQNHTDAIQAIGLSGQMHGVVLGVGEKPSRPAILWADGRSSGQLEAYHDLPETRRRLANPPAVGMAGPSLLWLKMHEPEVYARASSALQPKDWLRLRLTGRLAAEPSDASATLLYDLEADTWFGGLLETLGLRPDLLAPLQPSGSIAGKLTAEAAEYLGLRAGIPVAGGAGDTAAAMLGSGLLQPGTVQLSVGSGAQLVAPLERPQIDPSLRTHLYRAAAPGRWYAMAAMQNAGLALERVRGLLGLSWEEAYAEAFQVPPGCEGLTFLPYLTGERTPHLDPDARGHWAGLGLGHERGHLVRSALEGVAFSIREGMEALEASGVHVPEIRLVGGGTAHPEWRQLLSDVLERPLLASDASSASARGAALLGGIAVGVYPDALSTLERAPRPHRVAEPRPEAAAPLREAYHRFQLLYRRNKGIE